jgi:hypothetical protein
MQLAIWLGVPLLLGALAALRVGDVNQMNALKTVLGSCSRACSTSSTPAATRPSRTPWRSG